MEDKSMEEKSQVFQAGNFQIKSEDLQPLLFDDVELFLDMEEKKAESIKGMIKRTLKRAYTEIKDEDIAKILLKDVLELSKIIMKINGFENNEKE